MSSHVAALYAIRRKVLQMEIEVARAVGRTMDAGNFAAELRCLELFPLQGLSQRRGSLAIQMAVARCRMAELGNELAEWRARRARR